MSCLILVGNSIGEGSAKYAKLYYRISVLTSMIISGVVIALLLFTQDEIVHVFTSNPEIIKVLHQSWPLMLIYLMIQGL